MNLEEEARKEIKRTRYNSHDAWEAYRKGKNLLDEYLQYKSEGLVIEDFIEEANNEFKKSIRKTRDEEVMKDALIRHPFPSTLNAIGDSSALEKINKERDDDLLIQTIKRGF